MVSQAGRRPLGPSIVQENGSQCGQVHPPRSSHSVYGAVLLQEENGQYAYLHRFVRGDGDEYAHSHPWAVAKSLVLCGGYNEARYDGVDLTEERFVAGDENVILQSTLHRIVSVEPETWTLFVHSDWISDWGFATRWENGHPVIERRQSTSDGEGRFWWRNKITLDHLLRREPFTTA